MAGILALLVFGCLVLMGYGFSMWLQQRLMARRELIGRLRSMAGMTVAGESAPLLKDQRLSGIPAFDALLGQTPLIAPLAEPVGRLSACSVV